MPSGKKVVIVGGGPAGSSAAIACCINGIHPLIIDRKEKIGIPVQCGEGFTPMIGEMNIIEIPMNLMKWKNSGTTFYFDGSRRELKGSLWSTLMIDRDRYDRSLYDAAIRLGSERTVGEVVDCSGNVLYLKNGQRIEYDDLVIADGARSVFLNDDDVKRNVAYVKSFEIECDQLPDPTTLKIFIGDYCKKGYGYVFPKSERTANIGLGGLLDPGELDPLFDEFCSEELMKQILSRSKTISEKSGYAPLFKSGAKKSLPNAIMVGDAANDNIKPFVEGFIPGSVCGYLAGTALSLWDGEEAQKNYGSMKDGYFGDYASMAQTKFQHLCDEWDKLSNKGIVNILSDIENEGTPTSRIYESIYGTYFKLMVYRRKRKLKRTINFPTGPLLGS